MGFLMACELRRATPCLGVRQWPPQGDCSLQSPSKSVLPEASFRHTRSPATALKTMVRRASVGRARAWARGAVDGAARGRPPVWAPTSIRAPPLATRCGRNTLPRLSYRRSPDAHELLALSLPAHLSVCLPVCPSIHPPVHLPVLPSAHPLTHPLAHS